jgi:hypothetical protein
MRAGAAYCNVAARALDLAPAGHADSFDDVLLLETPLPWKHEIYQQAGALPQELIELLALWRKQFEAGRQGFRRVICFKRPAAAFAHFTRHEFLAPEEVTGALIRALYVAPDQLPTFASYRVPDRADDGQPVRDLLVCTHGAIDVACAKFGYPLYRFLRDAFAGEALRIWRVSHFGGHVFAPTLLDLPAGHYWAYVGEAQAAQIVRRDGAVAALCGHYRGWAGLPSGFAQAAEGAMWQHAGWPWFDYDREEIAPAAGAPVPAAHQTSVRIAYRTPSGAAGICTASVEVTHTVNTRHSTAGAAHYDYPQYRVTALSQTEPSVPGVALPAWTPAAAPSTRHEATEYPA